MIRKFLVLLTLSLILTSCLTVRNVYSVRDGSGGSYIGGQDTLFTIKSDKTGKLYGVLTGYMIDGADYSGAVTILENGDYEFNISEFNFFHSTPDGYTSGRYSAYGTFTFSQKEGEWTVIVTNKPEIVEVISGEERWGGTYYRLDEGKERVARKYDRLSAMSRFMHKIDGAPVQYPLHKTKVKLGISKEFGEDFYGSVKRVFIPEMFGYNYLAKSSLLVFNVSREDYNKGFVVKNENVISTGYTAAVIGDELKDVRNSGNMADDIRESVKLLRVLYNLEYFSGDYISSIKLKKTK